MNRVVSLIQLLRHFRSPHGFLHSSTVLQSPTTETRRERDDLCRGVDRLIDWYTYRSVDSYRGVQLVLGLRLVLHGFVNVDDDGDEDGGEGEGGQDHEGDKYLHTGPDDVLGVFVEQEWRKAHV